jgi:enoyl-CoA hydratase/carnithine racemase
MADLVEYAVNGRIAEIRFNRPEKLNALTNEMVRDLRELLYRIDADDDVWVGIIHGAGRAFSAGADVVHRMGTPGGRGVGASAVPISVLLSRFEHYKPIITAVHGYAIGGAMEIVLHSDLRVADETGKFQIVEIRRGIDGSGLWASMRLQGVGALADEVALTGRVFSAREAYEAGFISAVVPEGQHLSAARELAEQVMMNPPLAVRAVVKTRRIALEQLDVQMSATTRDRKLFATEDVKEARAAFAEKRKPVFKGC